MYAACSVYSNKKRFTKEKAITKLNERHAMNNNFYKALEITLEFEGGLSNRKDDPGGKTKWGITQKTYEMEYTGDVKDMTKAQCEQIYYRRYWLLSSCKDLPSGVDIVHFDTAVNCGPLQAAKLLQRAIGVEVDGVIGPRTRQTALVQDPLLLIDRYCDVRSEFYSEIVAKNEKLSVFLKGWQNRVSSLKEKATALC